MHLLVGFGGALLRTLLGKKRLMVEREEGSSTFDVTVPALRKGPQGADSTISEAAILVMTTKPELPSAMYLDESTKDQLQLKSSFGRGPVFNKITITPRVMVRGFTLSFNPLARKLILRCGPNDSDDVGCCG